VVIFRNVVKANPGDINCDDEDDRGGRQGGDNTDGVE